MRATERTDERVAQYLRLDSLLFQTTVHGQELCLKTDDFDSHELCDKVEVRCPKGNNYIKGTASVSLIVNVSVIYKG